MKKIVQLIFLIALLIGGCKKEELYNDNSNPVNNQDDEIKFEIIEGKWIYLGIDGSPEWNNYSNSENYVNSIYIDITERESDAVALTYKGTYYRVFSKIDETTSPYTVLNDIIITEKQSIEIFNFYNVDGWNAIELNGNIFHIDLLNSEDFQFHYSGGEEYHYKRP